MTLLPKPPFIGKPLKEELMKPRSGAFIYPHTNIDIMSFVAIVKPIYSYIKKFNYINLFTYIYKHSNNTNVSVRINKSSRPGLHQLLFERFTNEGRFREQCHRALILTVLARLGSPGTVWVI